MICRGIFRVNSTSLSLSRLRKVYVTEGNNWMYRFILLFYLGGGGGRGREEEMGRGEGVGRREMLRVRIDRRTNICSPTVFLCLKHSLFLPHHKWHKFVWKSNLRMFFWWIQKRAICIYCGISNPICSCISFFHFSLHQLIQFIKTVSQSKLTWSI